MRLAEKVCRWLPSGHAVHHQVGAKGWGRLSELLREPWVAWSKQHNFTCLNTTMTIKQWGEFGEQINWNGFPSRSFSIRVHRLVVGNKHFSVTDFTDFLKIIFHSLLKCIWLPFNFSELAREWEYKLLQKVPLRLETLGWQLSHWHDVLKLTPMKTALVRPSHKGLWAAYRQKA